MDRISSLILQKAQAYRNFSAETLSEIVGIPSFSGDEEAVCRRIVTMCREIGADEVRIDGLGSVVARIGTGPRTLAIDAHVDTVGIGDPDQWSENPFSGRIDDHHV